MTGCIANKFFTHQNQKRWSIVPSVESDKKLIFYIYNYLLLTTWVDFLRLFLMFILVQIQKIVNVFYNTS